LIKSFNLKTDESSLTGESLPVEKDADIVLTDQVGIGDRVNEVYMSTPIVYGRGEGVVIATGMKTEIGKIATALEPGEEETTPLQKNLAKLSKFLGYLTVGIVVLMFGVSLIHEAVAGHAFRPIGLRLCLMPWPLRLPLFRKACPPSSPSFWPWACRRWSRSTRSSAVCFGRNLGRGLRRLLR
jgi:Ca2+-transporting ATPase